MWEEQQRGMCDYKAGVGVKGGKRWGFRGSGKPDYIGHCNM